MRLARRTFHITQSSDFDIVQARHSRTNASVGVDRRPAFGAVDQNFKKNVHHHGLRPPLNRSIVNEKLRMFQLYLPVLLKRAFYLIVFDMVRAV